MEIYAEHLRRESRRYAERLWSELETLRALTGSLEKEHEVLSGQNRRMRAELELANATLNELARLQRQNGALAQELTRANELIDFYLSERADLRKRLAAIEAESSRYAEQYLDVEQQNSKFANFYVAVHQLHSTLDPSEVIGGIQEIVINLIGSEQVAIFDRKGDSLALAGAFGIDERAFASWPLAQGGFLSHAVLENEIVVRNGESAALALEEPLTACIPLRVGSQVIGAIAIFHLLEHKPALEPADHEMFELLAAHAGMALYATSLHVAAGTATQNVAVTA